MNETINYYDSNAQKFINDTLETKMTDIQSRFLEYVQPKGHILDLGCGSGRDSLMFIRNGYMVTAVDGSSAMCECAEKIIGQAVFNLTFDKIDFSNEFDAVWACASLLHIPSTELQGVIKKISTALKENGILYCSFKYGDFEGVRNGRYFTDYTEETISDVISKFPELRIVDLWITEDARPEREEKWVNVIVRKGVAVF